MGIVPFEDNLHEMSDLVFWYRKEKMSNLSYAEFAPGVVNVKTI